MEHPPHSNLEGFVLHCAQNLMALLAVTAVAAVTGVTSVLGAVFTTLVAFTCTVLTGLLTMIGVTFTLDEFREAA